MVLAKDIFKEFREHSVSEFFRKNAAMLGYTGKIRSLTTVVHEGVTNAIDAAEDAGILPSVYVAIRSIGEDSDHYKVIIEDNAAGIPDEYIPRVFGRMLAGTKLHRNVQNRGQQGIGISGGVMFSQATSGQPATVITSTEDSDTISWNEVMIDVNKNRGDVQDHREFDENGEWRGTRIEFEVKDVSYRHSRYGPIKYLRMTAIANPHVQITFEEPDGTLTIFERAAHEVPEQPEPVPPHPAGMRADGLLDLSSGTNNRSIGTFLTSELSRFSRNKLEELEKKVNVNLDQKPENMNWDEAEEIVSAFRDMEFMAPPTKGLRPIGEENIESGLNQILNPDYACATTRSPEVYHGGIPFIVETGLAYGGNAGDDAGSGETGLEIIRFANRAPLIFNQGGCALTKAAEDIDWKRYEIDPEKTPVTLFINIVSYQVPYTSAGKQSVADEPEVYEEVRQAVMASARDLKRFMKKKKRKREKRERANLFKTYLPVIARKAADISEKEDPDIHYLVEEIAVVELDE